MLNPWTEGQGYVLYRGNALEVLPALPGGMANCVVTSPPYYGLRDYGIPPSVWGGSPTCAHVFADLGVTRPKPDRCSLKDAGRSVFGGERGGQGAKAARGSSNDRGALCSGCGAWRGTLGLEPTPEMYIEHVVEVFRGVWRALRDDGTLWLNLGDSFANDAKWGGRSGAKNSGARKGGLSRERRVTGYAPKNLMMIPHRVALALQADGWNVRMDNVWSKPNPVPESVDDRPTKAHEYVFLLTKSSKYFYDAEAVREPQTGNAHSRGKGITPKTAPRVGEGAFIRANTSFHALTSKYHEAPDGKRNLRSVWTIPTKPFPGAHFATFPPELAETCILAGCPSGGVVLDPFHGSGTTGEVARRLLCRYVGVDVKEEYLEMSVTKRLGQGFLLQAEGA